MSVFIKTLRPATNTEWDHIWKECNYSTYFHSREWAEIWATYTKGKIIPEAKLLIYSDGKKVLLPLSRSKRRFLKTYITSPAGTYGGWLSSDTLTELHASLLVDYLSKFRNLFWRINPYNNLELKTIVMATTDDETHAIDLSIGFDAIYKEWTKGHASAARKARKEGVSIRTAFDKKDWGEYFVIYEDSLKRWGDKASSRYDWRLFEEIFFRRSKNIKLWLAVYQGQIIAGALCFYARKHVVYWHGAALDSYFNLRPVNLLMYEIIKDACEKEYSWFDFNPSGGHEGVKAFKRSFGAKPLPCPVVKVEMKMVELVKNLGSSPN